MNRERVYPKEKAFPAPGRSVGTYAWLKQNFFASPTSTLFTVLALWLIFSSVPGIINWLFLEASWGGTSRAACEAHPDGACWTFVKVRFLQLMFGLYFAAHADQVWRPTVMFVASGLLLALLLYPRTPYKRQIAAFTFFIFPFLAFALIHGEWLGLPVAEPSEWGGFMLTFILAGVGTAAALPLGVLLALGRNSSLPFIHYFSVAYIEFWRGTPLITVLFMSSVMLPLFFPEQVSFDKVARALIGLTMFSAAYTAEAIRGGLQAVPPGQHEAADSLGLGYWRKMSLVVLPQALKISIPAIVNTFIELFKDTTLVAIIGLLDLLYMAQAASRSLEWKGYELEAYLFTAFVFWIFCFGMSRYSQRLEKKLDRSHQSTTH